MPKKDLLVTSPRLNLLLFKMGINSHEDVISHLPRRYDSFEYTDHTVLRHLQDKQRIVIHGKIITSPKYLHFAKVDNVSFHFREDHGTDFKVVAWNRSYLGRNLTLEDDYTIQATYDEKRHEVNLLSIKKGIVPEGERMVPIYALPREYPPYSFAKLVAKSLDQCEGKIKDHLPPYFIKKYRFISRYEAYKKLHKPASYEDIEQGARVFKYEEALIFSLKNQLIRKKNKALTSTRKGEIDIKEMKRFIATLPYELTASQKVAVNEAVADMKSESLMYRLLQGDVGSGKTLVAALLLYANYTRGAQGALMAPTETLAKQHYETLCQLYKDTDVIVTLLTGSMDVSSKRAAMSDIADGTADIIVGTHALFSKGVSYNHLGLAIIDEQHKFGVNQRTRLADKGDDADVLLMSATPIPRTLSMTIYGDLDVSTLHEFPNKERKVETKIVRSSNKNIASCIEKSISTGHRVYVVAPRIERSEDADEEQSVEAVFARYQALYPHKVAIMHGRMKEDEKEAAIASFRTGLCPILCSTSVVEVGIDVKEADLLLVYEPQSFALSSLHQLRGRVGRDGSQSRCLLLYDGNKEEEYEKLKVLERTNDGFEIAEEDMRMRGPGELAGVRQSGLPDFQLVNLVKDFRMFEYARDDASYMLAHPKEEGFASLIKEAEAAIEDISLA